MALKLYTQAILFIDSTAIAECESIQITADSKAQIVETITGGLSGITKGASQLKFAIKNAVPDAAFEMDTGKYFKNGGIDAGKFCELSVAAGGKTIISEVFISNWALSYQVNGKAELSFDAIGTWSDWE